MDSLPPGVPLSQIPALKPPPGVKSNFVNPVSLAPAIIAVNVVFTVLMLLALMMRLYTKGVLLRCLWWDDYFALIGGLGSIAHAGLSIQQTNHGYGRHQWDVPLSVLTGNDIQVLQANTLTSYPTYFFVKVSALLLYLRIFSVKPGLRILIWLGIVLQFIGYGAFTGVAIGTVAKCTTAKAATTDSFCLDNWKVTYAQSIFSVVTDFYTLLLPIRVVLKLNMSSGRKLGIFSIFMTGLLACAASLARCIIAIDTQHTKDTLYAAGKITIFSAVEMNTGLIAGALTALPPFLVKSGAMEFGQSAFASIRSRLVGISRSSVSSQQSRHSKRSKFERSETTESSIELREQQSTYIPTKAAAGARDTQAIVRTDDYEVHTTKRMEKRSP